MCLVSPPDGASAKSELPRRPGRPRTPMWRLASIGYRPKGFSYSVSSDGPETPNKGLITHERHPVPLSVPALRTNAIRQITACRRLQHSREAANEQRHIVSDWYRRKVKPACANRGMHVQSYFIFGFEHVDSSVI